ncbi:Protein CBG27576 [Caenorhabditis briggsae]|uniref:Protein CBG27576 n=1 Tax=Caenorhabditis briggsae TaxID=6238 RepID=B6IFS0_CAEBR|nr:Protein CBG27576 [Caenorhabditis briggsae]CAR98750.1 Protein CBG27576 [Caenorhabditis briggsae]
MDQIAEQLQGMEIDAPEVSDPNVTKQQLETALRLQAEARAKKQRSAESYQDMLEKVDEFDANHSG